MRTALVGGASRGLGLACAQALAQQGCRVVMCARTSDALERAARATHAATRAETIAVPCDWSSSRALAALEQELAQRKLQIDILVNNVGGPQPGTATELSDGDWEQGLDLLFRSTLRMYRMVLPGIRQRRWGRIVNILSTAVVEPIPALAISSVLRSGLAAYAKLVAWDVARDGVTVNSVMPGPFRTARTEALQADAARRRNVPLATVQAEAAAHLPVGRLLQPEELGHCVAYLASDQASGITAALLPVDGGLLRSL